MPLILELPFGSVVFHGGRLKKCTARFQFKRIRKRMPQEGASRTLWHNLFLPSAAIRESFSELFFGSPSPRPEPINALKHMARALHSLRSSRKPQTRLRRNCTLQGEGFVETAYRRGLKNASIMAPHSQHGYRVIYVKYISTRYRKSFRTKCYMTPEFRRL